MKQRSHWTVDAIGLAYASVDLQYPIGVRNSTREFYQRNGLLLGLVQMRFSFYDIFVAAG